MTLGKSLRLLVKEKTLDTRELNQNGDSGREVAKGEEWGWDDCVWMSVLNVGVLLRLYFTPEHFTVWKTFGVYVYSSVRG